MLGSETFWLAFAAALIGTLKVFAIGAAGFVMVRCRWLSETGLQAIGQLTALLTVPCLVFYRFATQFDPATSPGWWKFALMGAGITAFGLVMGKLVALRHGNNEEVTMLVGFQNAGFFVLPMLQALLPAHDYNRGSLLLFVLLIPFNASMWLVGSWLLLKRKGFDPRIIFTPPFISTLISVVLYGFAHDFMHRWDNTVLLKVLFGDAAHGGAVGAMQQIGDLTVPLATLTLGGSIALNLRGRIEYKRAALEVALMRLVVVPALGYWFLLQVLPRDDYVVWILFMLQFASPPAIALSVFSQQHGYRMRLIPAASLLCYILCLVTVPFFVALVPR